MDEFRKLSRRQRLWLTGARLHELETRTPGAIESDKWNRAMKMFWSLIECSGSLELDDEWVTYCIGDKMSKYLKTLHEMESE